MTYNLLRAALFGACFGIGWLAGLRSVVLVVAALLVSGVLSWFVLGRQREAMGQAVERTMQRSRVRMADRTAKEDAYVDSLPPLPSAEPPVTP